MTREGPVPQRLGNVIDETLTTEPARAAAGRALGASSVRRSSDLGHYGEPRCVTTQWMIIAQGLGSPSPYINNGNKGKCKTRPSVVLVIFGRPEVPLAR
jgi:hypothetical protein